MNDIEIFFADPNTEPADAGKAQDIGKLSAKKYGLLYLLRRDIRSCLPSSSVTPLVTIPWLGAIGIFAGIDLLSQHKAGTNEDDRGKASTGDADAWRYSSSQRFQKFIVDHFPEAAKEKADVIYQLRCALAHSYATVQEAVSKTESGRKEKRSLEFLLTDHKSENVISLQGESLYLVNLYALHDAFEYSIDHYRKELEDTTSKARFNTMFAKHGTVFIYPPQPAISFEKIDSCTLGMGASGVALNAYIPEFNTATRATADPTK